MFKLVLFMWIRRVYFYQNLTHNRQILQTIQYIKHFLLGKCLTNWIHMLVKFSGKSHSNNQLMTPSRLNTNTDLVLSFSHSRLRLSKRNLGAYKLSNVKIEKTVIVLWIAMHTSNLMQRCTEPRFQNKRQKYTRTCCQFCNIPRAAWMWLDMVIKYLHESVTGDCNS